MRTVEHVENGWFKACLNCLAIQLVITTAIVNTESSIC